jgi:HemY protein
MFKLLAFVALLLALAFGFAQVADTPGHVLVQFGETELRVTLVTALVALLVLTALAMIFWSLVRFVLRLPGLISLSNRVRRREKGQLAVARGLVAVGVGDQRQAMRHAAMTEKLLGAEPLALLLKAQTAQLSGDERGAELAFKAMLDNPDTQALGLRGLFIESERRGDLPAARQIVEQAYRLGPASAWANAAMLRLRAGQADWRGALEVVEQGISRRLIDKTVGKEQRAVLLAAAALETREANPDQAMALALEAVRLQPDLVPAVEIAARRYTAQGEYGKATRLIETAWKSAPHPDLADAYLHVRPGDSAADRLKRARQLEKLNPQARESRLALARAAIDAREFATAREALDSLVLQKSSARACLLMAELEEMETSNQGLVRAWLARASRAPRDPAWVADGVVSHEWRAFSPLSGRIGAFRWEEPPQAQDVALRARIDADRFETVEPMPAVEPVLLDAPAIEAPAGAEPNQPSASKDEPPRPIEEVIRPFIPDDPGPDPQAPPPRRRFGLFG